MATKKKKAGVRAKTSVVRLPQRAKAKKAKKKARKKGGTFSVKTSIPRLPE